MMTVDFRALALVERKDGFDRAQPEPYGANGTGSSYEMIPPFGLLGRPRGPTDGNGATGIVLMHGSEGFVIATTDPRTHAGLPDLGDGGAGLYATVEVDGAVQTPYLAFFGKNGEQDEGTFRVTVPTAAGTTTIEVDATTGDVTIEHAAGTKAIVKSDAVYLGDDSALPLVKDTPFQAWAATVVTALGALGQTITAPAGTATTKVNGT
jgi:hypothetical protein